MIKKFGDYEINIREMGDEDLKIPEKYADFINSLIDEDAYILMCTKKTKKDEIGFIKDGLRDIKSKKRVKLVAECNGKIIGNTSITLKKERESHIGGFGISVRNGYRGIGLGRYLMQEVIELAKKKLDGLKIVKLSVHEGNDVAKSLYLKMGFKEVAQIPKQVQHGGKLISETVMLLEV